MLTKVNMILRSQYYKFIRYGKNKSRSGCYCMETVNLARFRCYQTINVILGMWIKKNFLIYLMTKIDL